MQLPQVVQEQLANTKTPLDQEQVLDLLRVILREVVQDEKYTLIDLARMGDVDVLTLAKIVWPDTTIYG